MWWLETTGYHLGGLIWLIVVAVIFLIALAALIVGGSAMSRATTARKLAADRVATAETAPLEEERATTVSSDPALTDANKVLHERYARGDITREEYLQRRDDLNRAENGMREQEKVLRH